MLLDMKKYFNVRFDGRARQQNNVIEMAVREHGAKAILRVLHCGAELLPTVGVAKHGHGTLNMRNAFGEIAGREDEAANMENGEVL